jgi:serine/threonine protein kinase
MVNKKPYGIKADSWAYGCVIFSLVAGGPPFDCNGDIKTTVTNIRNNKIKYPENMNPYLHDLLNRIFQEVTIPFFPK